MDGGKELILSERLLAIAQWIPPGSRVAEHRYGSRVSPDLALQHGCAAFIAACDVREGPLDMPAVLLRSTVLQEKLSFRLGSGLSCVAPDEIDTIVIAGMGGETILSILEASLGQMTRVIRFTAAYDQSGSAAPVAFRARLRFFKGTAGTGNRTYFPIMALRGGGTGQPLSIGQAWGGVALQDDPCRATPWMLLLHLCTYALNGLERSTVPKKPGTR